MPIIKVENVSFSYEKNNKVINNLSLVIEKGQYVAVVGHNGSGKSTLARLFNGLLVPESGSITVCDMPLSDKKNIQAVRSKVGVVFQNPDNQLVASIVEDDVAFGPENLGVPRNEIGERIDYALKVVGMEKFRKSATEHLSGGQKQRIAIAGVLALKPEIIILDESTSMLDPEGRNEVLKAVKKLNKEEGVTVVAITHYMEEVLDADRVIILTNGEIAEQGSPRELFIHRKNLKSYGLEAPIASYIAEKLREKGVPIREGVLTEQEVLEELCRLGQKI